MKRILFILFVTVMTAGLVCAQSTNQLFGKTYEPEKTEIRGNLGISHGFISVESGGVVYYVMGLQRFIGFIDGLKAGAGVILEGYVLPQQNQNPRFFRATKLDIGGKDYDLSPPPGMEKFRQRDFMGPRFPDRRPGQSPRPHGYDNDRNRRRERNRL
jgi:hypothetical protein